MPKKVVSLLIATHNKAKFKEIYEGLIECFGNQVRILSLDDVHITDEPEETGISLRENALIKAKYYGSRTNLPVISDDGGIAIDILDGEPGVRSRRWPGHEAPDEELIAYTLEKLRGVPRNQRSAALTMCLCFYDPKMGKTLFEEEKNKGHIAEKPYPHYTKGYPYRALFIVDTLGKYYDELTPEEHGRLNHRLIALRRLCKKIKHYLIQ